MESIQEEIKKNLNFNEKRDFFLFKTYANHNFA